MITETELKELNEKMLKFVMKVAFISFLAGGLVGTLLTYLN